MASLLFPCLIGHNCSDLSPEDEASLATYRKSEERIRMEQQLKSKKLPSPEGTDDTDKAEAHPPTPMNIDGEMR